MLSYCSTGLEFLFEMMKKEWRWVVMEHNEVSVMNATVVPQMAKEEHFILNTLYNKESKESLNKIKWII